MRISQVKNHFLPSSNWNLPSCKEVVIKTTQLAIKILFSAAILWMGAALLPLITCKGLILAAAVIGSVFIGTIFFKNPCFVFSPFLINQTPVVIDPTQPRGIWNIRCNCWVNSMLQFLMSSKTASEWIKKEQESPEEKKEKEEKDFYQKLVPLCDFYQAHDAAIEGNKKVVPFDSQKIREMISRSSNISNNCGQQEDAHEGLSVILNPNFYPGTAQIQETTHYSTEGLPPLPESDNGIKSKKEPCVSLCLAVSENPESDLNEMLAQYFDETPRGQCLEVTGEEGQVYSYEATKIKRQYLSAPPELWIQIKRFGFDKTQSKPSKNQSAVKIPDTITIHPIDGSEATYRLNSHVNHKGKTPQAGHYVAYRHIGDKLYCCNDSSVTLVAPQDQEKARSKAYLLHYERVLES